MFFNVSGVSPFTQPPRQDCSVLFSRPWSISVAPLTSLLDCSLVSLPHCFYLWTSSSFITFCSLFFVWPSCPKLCPLRVSLFSLEFLPFLTLRIMFLFFPTGLISDTCVWEIFTDLTMIIVFYAILHLYIHPRIFLDLSWSFCCP